MPRFEGGDVNKFKKWVLGNFETPAHLAKEGFEGRITLRFVVEKDGSIGEVVVPHSINADVERELVRVIKSSPKWEAAGINKQSVRVAIVMSMMFVRENAPLQETEPEKVEISEGDRVPLFRGKDARVSFRQWMANNLFFPKEWQKRGWQGVVVFKFVVERNGEISNVEILRGINDEVDNTVAKLVKNSKGWTPGYRKDTALRVNMIMDVSFFDNL